MMKPHRLMCGILLIGVVGCGHSERDWKQAKESNTVSAYADFIAKHPHDKHVADAKAGIEGLPLKLSVSSVAVANRFQAYVGGGSNIKAPTPIVFGGGGGGGIPLISISNGSTFLAGEVSSTDAGVNLVRIEIEVRNPTQKSESFKIGDLSLTIAGVRMGDFIAVGYDDRLCAVSGADLQKVKEILVEISPQSRRTLSYVFALPKPGSQRGQLVLQSAAPVLFEIGEHSSK